MEAGTIGYLPIEQYGAIGDLRTIALVSTEASIDFLCLPRFDSPSVFAALLDDRRGGRCTLGPSMTDVRHKQMYYPDSNLLMTRFLSEAGVGEVVDFMPVGPHGATQTLVRRAKTVRGELRFRLRCAPRFDYGRAAHRVELAAGGCVFAPEASGIPALRLRSTVPLSLDEGDAGADFILRAGERAEFVLEQAGRDSPASAETFAADAFQETLDYWRAWIGRSGYRGRWREIVNRSALVLKLLTADAYGAPVAAGTFGLPEWIGGTRNWDYRYTWIRDASFAMHALISLGYVDEPRAFMRWIADRCEEAEPDGLLQLMYRVDGGRDLEEFVLPQFEGYEGSRPVRIGNAASGQVQLDIYGELVDAVYQYHRHRGEISDKLWSSLSRLVDWVCEHWREPDNSIWEVRGGPHEFLYSRLMCWVAIDRALRIAMDKVGRLNDRWQSAREEIYRNIYDEFWDPRRQAYVQIRGSSALGAAALRMPLARFVGPTDPRWRATMRAIEQDLVDDALVYRYRTEQSPDGIAGSDAAFVPCSFWYIECLSRAGELEKARLLFEELLGYANHLGLYAEELGRRGEHLGNFPQAFTHLALISAASDLDRRLTASAVDGGLR
jgi:GH15 family glucan-1,4-alpha-glucosidase